MIQGYWDGYDASVNPGVIDAFASAAFRFGHSLLPTAVERWSKAHKFIGSYISLFTLIIYSITRVSEKKNSTWNNLLFFQHVVYYYFRFQPASKRLSDLIRRPYDLYRAGVLDEYLMGLMNQVAQAMDDSITQEVNLLMYKQVAA